MAKAEAYAARPLSPHLTIFRPYINMVMSVLHRITGAANYFGTLLLVAWLTATASGPDGFLQPTKLPARRSGFSSCSAIAGRSFIMGSGASATSSGTPGTASTSPWSALFPGQL